MGDNDALWSTTAGPGLTNWSSSPDFNNGTPGVPGAADDVFFVFPGAGNLSSQLGANFSIRSLNFTSEATSPITIGGANLLTLGAGGLTSNAPGAVTLSTTVELGAPQTWANNSATPVTLSGNVSGSVLNDLTLAGAGGFTFTSANSYAGNTTIFTGGATLSGNGSILSTSNITLNAGTTLTLNNTATNVADRVADNTTITSKGGVLNLVGNAAGTSETFGTLAFGSGSTIVRASGASTVATFGAAGTIPSFAPLDGGTVAFQPTGGAVIKAPNVTLVNTAIPGNAIIGGHAVVGALDNSGALEWATVDVSGNVVALPASGYQTLTVAPLSTDNAKGNAGIVVFNAGSQSLNTLYLTGSGGLNFTGAGSTDVLTIGAGGIISNGATGIGHYDNKANIGNMAFIGAADSGTNNVGGTLAYNGRITSSTTQLNVFTASNLRIASVITGAIGLTKSGNGILDLSNGNTQNQKTQNTFTGNVTVNEGILLFNDERNLGQQNLGTLVPDAITFNGGEIRTFAGTNFNVNRGITVGTRGGTFSYTGGGTSTITQKITGVGGFTYYARDNGGGGGEIIVLNNVTAGRAHDYQGPTTFWMSLRDDGTNVGVLRFAAANQVPSTSAVTGNLVDDTAAHNVVANNVNAGPDMNGTTQSFGSLAGNLNLRNHNGSLTLGANNLSTTFNGSIYGANTTTAGSGSLTKVGSGAQTLSGPNNRFTGATSINGGTLLIGSGTATTSTAALFSSPVSVGNGSLIGSLGGNGTIHSTVTVTSTGHLAPAMSVATFNTLTINNNLTVNAGATLDFNFGALGTPGAGDRVDLIGTGSLNLQAGADVLNITQLPGFGIGTYRLFSVSGTGSFTDNATFTINGRTNFNYSVLKPGEPIDVAAGGGVVPTNQLWLQVLQGNPSLTWIGGVDGNWNLATANWSGDASIFTSGSNVTFDEFGAARPAVTVIAGGVTANSIVFANAGVNYTIGGGAINVTAGAGITKNQAGNVTLSGAVTTPLTTVNAGTITVGGTLNSASMRVNAAGSVMINIAGALGASTALNVAGQVTFLNAAQSLSTLANDSGITTGVLNLDGPTALTVGSGGFDGQIKGGGSLVKTSTGLLTLTNTSSSFSGGVSVRNGTLSVSSGLDGGAPGQLGTSIAPIALGDAVTAGVLQYTGTTTATTRGFNLAIGGGGFEVTQAGQALTINGVVNNGASPLTLAGLGDGVITAPLDGSGAVTKSGTGTWTLAGSAAPSGATPSTIYSVQGGMLAAVATITANPFGLATIALDGGNLGLSGSSPVGFDHTVNVNQNATITAFQSGFGGATANNPVSLGGSGNVTIAAARTLTLATANGYNLTIAGNVGGPGGLTSTGNVALSGNNTYGGATNVTAGTFSINGSLTSTGAVTVSGAGVLTANGPISTTGNALVNGGAINANAAFAANSLTVAAGTYNGNAALNTATGVTISGGTARITAAANGLGAGPVLVQAGALEIDPGTGLTANLAGISIINDAVLRVRSGTADLGNTTIVTNKPHASPSISGQLTERFFRPADAGVANFLTNGGDPGITFENGDNFLTRVPGAIGVLGATDLTFTGAQIQTRANAIVANLFPGTDNEGAAWAGRITVGGPNLPAGPVSFGTNSDDGSVIYVDLNQDGFFQGNERVVGNAGSHGLITVTNTVDLAAGTYNFAVGWYNGNGGQQIDAKFAPGSNVAFATQAFINPGTATQAGVFSSPATPGGVIQVDAGATLSAGGFTADVVAFGAGSGTGTLSLKSHPTLVASAADSFTMVGSNTQATLDLGANNTATAVAINFGTNGVLVKTGAGTLVATGTGTGAGSILVNDGALVVNGSVSGSVEINAGVLGGTGTVGRVTVFGGSLAPGASAGILNTGNLELNGGTLAIELAGNVAGNGAGRYDQVNVTGTVALFGPIELTLDFSTYNPQDNVDVFTIVRNDLGEGIALNGASSRLVFGLTTLDEGTIFTAISGAFSQPFRVSYVGGDGNDLTLTAVPEPASIFCLLGGFAVVAGSRRRRTV